MLSGGRSTRIGCSIIEGLGRVVAAEREAAAVLELNGEIEALPSACVGSSCVDFPISGSCLFSWGVTRVKTRLS